MSVAVGTHLEASEKGVSITPPLLAAIIVFLMIFLLCFNVVGPIQWETKLDFSAYRTRHVSYSVTVDE